MKKRCDVRRLFTYLTLKNAVTPTEPNFMLELVNEAALIRRLGNPPEIMQHEPDVEFIAFSQLWVKMRRLEDNGVRISGPMDMTLQDMRMQDVVGSLVEFVMNPVIGHLIPPSSMLSAKWETGGCNISMQDFFPCEDRQLSGLIDAIHLDTNDREHITRLRLHFMKRILECEWMGTKVQDDFVKQHGLVQGQRVMLSTRKLANGELLSDQQYRYYSNNYSNEVGCLYKYLAIAKQYKERMLWFVSHLKELV